jgi:hypothetical protein
MAQTLGTVVGRDTMLNLLRAVPEPEVGEVVAVGVDDFALRRGHAYCTVLLDMATRRPVEVLEGREAEPLARWLASHRGFTATGRVQVDRRTASLVSNSQTQIDLRLRIPVTVADTDVTEIRVAVDDPSRFITAVQHRLTARIT